MKLKIYLLYYGGWLLVLLGALLLLGSFVLPILHFSGVRWEWFGNPSPGFVFAMSIRMFVSGGIAEGLGVWLVRLAHKKAWEEQLPKETREIVEREAKDFWQKVKDKEEHKIAQDKGDEARRWFDTTKR